MNGEPKHVKACERCGLMRVTNETRPANLCQDCRYIDHPVDQRSWHNDAACHSHPDKKLWQTTTPRRGRREDIEIAQDRIEIAKAICAGCPVSAECLEASRNEPTGIWGGLDVAERARHFGKSAGTFDWDFIQQLADDGMSVRAAARLIGRNHKTVRLAAIRDGYEDVYRQLASNGTAMASQPAMAAS